ncbi:sulfatase-like hydrolase/transferase [Aestuariibius sp. 2305UL40-4]|uniref:sulfatase-like hydrolase/transferase n=1 Tax=Aestuariibius violaceus TaxID=3234132 RepID=UPI00345EF8D7
MTAKLVKERVMIVGGALLAAMVLHLVLIQPNHPDAVSWRALLLFPLELPAILLALIAFGQGRLGSCFRLCLVAVLAVIAVLKAADFAMFLALNRGFNLVADFPLIASLYQLTVGAFGPLAAALSVVAIMLAVVGLFAALWWACGYWARLAVPVPVAVVSGVAATLMTAVAVVDVGARMGKWAAPTSIPGTAFTARVGVERYQMIRDTLADLRNFRAEAQDDPFAQQDGLLDLVDRDVIIVFVESYGRTSFDTPLFADLHRETLEAAETTLDAKGLSMASTYLISPTQGGQSWLAHSSFANGLWIDNQTSYHAALSSGRKTLFHLATQSGFGTAAVMPQITLHWPESRSMGFDTILAAADLGYEGAAFNWITMPDQFTFAAMDRFLRTPGADDDPLFIQVATGSSHAPWVPVPDLLDWDDLGDGTVFNPIVEASDTPREVWRDHDRVRAQYRLAVDYALQTVFAYAELHAEDPPLMLIIGDHQAAGFVALDERPHVPLHIVGPEHLVGLLADDGFSAGLIPDAETEPRPMSALRAHLLNALTSTNVRQAAR